MVDESLDDQVWVTVVATRYGEPRARRDAGASRSPRASRASSAARAQERGRQHGANRHRRQSSSTCPSSCRAAKAHLTSASNGYAGNW